MLKSMIKALLRGIDSFRIDRFIIKVGKIYRKELEKQGLKINKENVDEIVKEVFVMFFEEEVMKDKTFTTLPKPQTVAREIVRRVKKLKTSK